YDVTDDLHDDIPLSRLVVQFRERDLLPGAEGGTAVDDRDREARAEEGRAHVAVAVPVLPPTLMAVFHALREEPLQGVRDVFRHQTWLELVRHDRTRAARREDADEAVLDPGLCDRGLDPVRHVDRLNARLRVDPDRLSVGGHGGGKTREMQEACRPLPGAAKKEVARAEPPPLPRGRPKPSRVGVGWGEETGAASSEVRWTLGRRTHRGRCAWRQA